MPCGVHGVRLARSSLTIATRGCGTRGTADGLGSPRIRSQRSVAARSQASAEPRRDAKTTRAISVDPVAETAVQTSLRYDSSPLCLSHYRNVEYNQRLDQPSPPAPRSSAQSHLAR